MEAFAIFCGMGIHNTHMYEKAIVAMAKQSVTLEVLSYHASASMEDAQRLRVSERLLNYNPLYLHRLRYISITSLFLLFSLIQLQTLKIPSAAYFQLHDFNFDDIYMDDDDTLRVIAVKLSPVIYNLSIACYNSFISLFVYLVRK